jgi:NTP pyrophosphatase (non-canonical NTP hydrolase)
VKLGEYQLASRETAVYPGIGVSVVYPTLGLAGETGELLEKALSDSPTEDFMGELGDVLWYLAQLAAELSFDLEALLQTEAGPETGRAAAPGAVDHASSVLPTSLIAACSVLVVDVGAVTECTKKLLRDDLEVLTHERHGQFHELLSKALVSWHLVAHQAGISPETCAAVSYAKLMSRLERGVVSGSGDYR